MKTKLTSTEYNEEMWRRRWAKSTQKISTVNRIEIIRTTFPRDCTLIQVYNPYDKWPYQFTYYKLVRECKRAE